MEEQSKTNEHLNIQAEDGKVEIIHRYGEAPKVQDPVEVTIDGRIGAPYEYFRHGVKNETIDTSKAHLMVNDQSGEILLNCDPKSPVGTRVRGKLNVNPRLAKMRLGDYGQTRFSEEEFVLLLKQCRPLFSDQQDCLDLVHQVKNIRLNVDRLIERSDDDRGNRREHFEQVCESDLMHSFTLDTHLFEVGRHGSDPFMFEVEVKYHYSSSLELWLESDEYEDAFREEMEAIIGEQVLLFEEQIPVIYT